MNTLSIPATLKSLNVRCEKGIIALRGRSSTNDPQAFFEPVEKWISNYLLDPAEDTMIHIKLDYIDTASLKYVFEILKSFEIIIDRNKSVHVNWYYENNDPELLELGEIVCSKIKIPTRFIEA